MNQIQDLERQAQDPGVLPPRQADQVFSPLNDRADRAFRRFLIATFILFVGAPTLALAAYLLFVMSPQYMVQAQFIVRGDVSNAGIKQAGLSGAVTSQNRPQEASMLAKYVPSRAFVEALAPTLDVASFFNKDHIDSWSRLSPGAAMEDVAAFWSSMVSVSTDGLSGVVTYQVHAFSPEDALTLATAAQQQSETMLNRLLDKLRNDGLRIANQDRQRAFEELRVARQEIENFRRDAGTLNPTTAGADALQLILSRRTERVETSAQLTAALATLSPNAPQVKVIRARLAALDQQIAALEADLTRHGSPDALAALISKYDELDLKRGLAEQNFKRSELTVLRTKAEMDRWHVYLLAVTPPSIPTEPDRPQVFKSAGYFFFVAFMLWSIGALLATGTMDHRR